MAAVGLQWNNECKETTCPPHHIFPLGLSVLTPAALLPHIVPLFPNRLSPQLISFANYSLFPTPCHVFNMFAAGLVSSFHSQSLVTNLHAGVSKILSRNGSIQAYRHYLQCVTTGDLQQRHYIGTAQIQIQLNLQHLHAHDLCHNTHSGRHLYCFRG